MTIQQCVCLSYNKKVSDKSTTESLRSALARLRNRTGPSIPSSSSPPKSSSPSPIPTASTDNTHNVSRPYNAITNCTNSMIFYAGQKMSIKYGAAPVTDFASILCFARDSFPIVRTFSTATLSKCACIVRPEHGTLVSCAATRHKHIYFRSYTKQSVYSEKSNVSTCRSMSLAFPIDSFIDSSRW